MFGVDDLLWDSSGVFGVDILGSLSVKDDLGSVKVKDDLGSVKALSLVALPSAAVLSNDIRLAVSVLLSSAEVEGDDAATPTPDFALPPPALRVIMELMERCRLRFLDAPPLAEEGDAASSPPPSPSPSSSM